jgi:hypothetical protein
MGKLADTGGEGHRPKHLGSASSGGAVLPLEGRPGYLLLVRGLFILGDRLVGNQVHTVSSGQPFVVLDGGHIPGVHWFGVRSRPGRGSFVMVRVVLVAGFLEMVLQLLLRVAAALTHSPHLLCCGRRMRVLVRAVVMDTGTVIFAHTEIVPPNPGAGKGLSAP